MAVAFDAKGLNECYRFDIPELGTLLVDCRTLPWKLDSFANESERDDSVSLFRFITQPEPLSGCLAQGTLFQRTVWKALCQIPFGKTLSYRQLAVRIGCPKAYRAVANAAAQNPFPLVIPCHRLIRSDGKPGGYSAGCGSELKVKLLLWEKRFSAIASSLLPE